MNITDSISSIVRNVATEQNYDIAENKRLIIQSKPPLNYQPDFFLIGRNGVCVIELEITTDAVKAVIGDIVRAGLIGAHKFVAVSKDRASATLIKNYGQSIVNRIVEFRHMKVYSLYRKNDRSFRKELTKIL